MSFIIWIKKVYDTIDDIFYIVDLIFRSWNTFILFGLYFGLSNHNTILSKVILLILFGSSLWKSANAPIRAGKLERGE